MVFGLRFQRQVWANSVDSDQKEQSDQVQYCLSFEPIMIKPVLGVCDQLRLKLACSAPETS